MQEKEKYTESSVSEQDFLKAIDTFEKARDSRGYYEMIKDINHILRDWDEVSSTELRDEYYPSWKPEDFRRLLAELGEDEWEKPKHTPEPHKKNPTVDEIKQQKEQIEKSLALEAAEYARAERALFEKDLQDQVRALELEVRFLKKDSPFPSLEEELEYHKANKVRGEASLVNMGWFQRFKEREKVKNTKTDIQQTEKTIKDLEEKIRLYPLSKRQAEQAQADAQRRKKIQDFEQKIAEIRARLEKMKA